MLQNFSFSLYKNIVLLKNSNNLIYVGAQDALLIEMANSKKAVTTVNGTSFFWSLEKSIDR